MMYISTPASVARLAAFSFVAIPPVPRSLPDTVIQALFHDSVNGGEYRDSLPVTDIEVTNVGLHFCYPADPNLFMESVLRLKDGTMVESSGGLGSVMEDGRMFYTSQWRFPVDLDQAEALILGSTEIPMGG